MSRKCLNVFLFSVGRGGLWMYAVAKRVNVNFEMRLAEKEVGEILLASIFF